MEVNIGNSLYDEEGANIVKEIVDSAAAQGVELVLPVDFVVLINSARMENEDCGSRDGRWCLRRLHGFWITLRPAAEKHMTF